MALQCNLGNRFVNFPKQTTQFSAYASLYVPVNWNMLLLLL